MHDKSVVAPCFGMKWKLGEYPPRHLIVVENHDIHRPRRALEVKSEILKQWRTLPNPHWYESKQPGSYLNVAESLRLRLSIEQKVSPFVEDFCTSCEILLQIASWTASKEDLSISGIAFLKCQWFWGVLSDSVTQMED
ncbi:hypothetical protein TNCV_1502501 [Trichonephila clavipes]|uniref:Uncharacterized protein n=1 Tax=Trichonephila clavipes TaxID=2585209 RepID=A0A8X6V8D5_TRICX|nr:hypothetical protein TNCV_1502501 [Trichonephila clavipes]